MVNRRTFAGGLAGLAIAPAMRSAEPERRTRFYTLDAFRLKQGTQPARMQEWLSTGFLPAFAKFHPGPVIAMDAVFGPHTPEIVVIAAYSSFEEIWSMRSKIEADADAGAAYEMLDRGPEPPFENHSLSLLEATPYSPEIVAAKRDKPRYFELRQYHSPTRSQLQALHQRFAGPESRVFHRSGIFPILYSSGLAGENLPNLTYLIPFESLAAREKAWDAFTADPEWVKARKESIDQHGQIVAVSGISIYRATPYSPVS
jgi:hypothetical protein